MACEPVPVGAPAAVVHSVKDTKQKRAGMFNLLSRSGNERIRLRLPTQVAASGSITEACSDRDLSCV